MKEVEYAEDDEAKREGDDEETSSAQHDVILLNQETPRLKSGFIRIKDMDDRKIASKPDYTYSKAHKKGKRKQVG